MPKHIKSAKDLITSHSATRAGFLEQAVEKAKAAQPYIKTAQKFRTALSKVKNIDNISEDLSDFKDELVAAAGLSVKASKHLTVEELEDLIKKSIKAASAESDFRQELLDRYLLTKGDALGGSMRNRIGSLAGEKLISYLKKSLSKYTLNITTSSKGKIQRIEWENRMLVFDYKPALIGKNIDLILLDTSKFEKEKLDHKKIAKDITNYLACGELKGGIDPAGADEHWKTANSALERIRLKLKKKIPATFFVGAAIEVSMADEIFAQLQSGKLTYAANLNSPKQVKDLVDWLVSL